MYGSVPFTWDLPKVKAKLMNQSFLYDEVVLGGPAIYLMPDFFLDLPKVSIGPVFRGVLQRIHPLATRTTVGCPRNCMFCGVNRFEPRFKELPDWPDLPILCDNNVLAASQPHFDRVVDRLKKHKWCDFNQGIDARLLTGHHASRLKELNNPVLRLALDSMEYADQWEEAFRKLIKAKIPKKDIRSYALVGFDSGPDEAWKRCKWIEKHGIKPLPMWFHPLDSLQKNQVTDQQKELGWSGNRRKAIMQWFYQHKAKHLRNL